MANGSPQVRRSDFGDTDSAGYEWEEINHPVTPSDREHLVAPPKPSAQEQKPLCGYLHKLTFKGPIRTWRTRWFMFDEQGCCLYYYNERTDSLPAGKIEVSSATLTYDMENLSKHQFEITSEGRVVSLQASSQEAMLYWLTTLQQKRRKFSSKRKKMLVDNTPEKSAVAGGLCGEEGGAKESEDANDITQNNVLQVAPCDLEDRSAFTSSQSKQVFSRLSRLTNSILKPGTGGVARSSSVAGSPGSYRKLTEITSAVAENDSEVTVTQDGSPRHPHRENSPAVNTPPGVDVPPPIRQNRPTRNFTNRLSLNFRRSASGPCPRCLELQDELASVKIDLQIKEREVLDRDEINEFLRNEIRMSDMREKVAKELSTEDNSVENSDKRVDILIQREQTIEQLQRLLEEAITEKDRVTTELDAKRSEVQSLGEQVSLLKEALTAKDQVVVDLTNQLFSLENKGQVPNDPLEVMLPQSTQSLEVQITRLKEAVEAYKTQNQFLSSEIVELNALRAEDLETYRALSNKYHETEARFFKAQSKYMVLLQEAQNPRMGVESGPDQDMVSQMLEEALGSDEQSVTKDRSNSYDQYGFSEAHATADKESITNPLKIKAKKFDQRAQQALSDTDASHRVRWENFMARHGGGRELTRSTELKQLIRSGVPRTYRTQVWKWMTKSIVGKRYMEGQYEAILQQHAGQTSVAVNQIELDLLRTLPTNKYYDKPDAQGIDKLRRVLVAFSWYDQNVGYCQGLNRLAAIALLFLEEADAFWCIVAIVHHILPGDYYSKTLLGSQTDQRVLKDLLRDKAPKLSDHLGICDIDFSLITFNWFHTVFVDNLPVDTMLRIWDTFLYEGSKVLFRFAIAIFKFNEEALLATENSIGIFNKLRTMCQDATDVNRLVQIGFHEINPFPKRKIEHMRHQYRLQIRAELEALDNLRSQAPVPVVRPTVHQDPPTADLLGSTEFHLEPSYKDLLAEEDSDGEEETIFLP